MWGKGYSGPATPFLGPVAWQAARPSATRGPVEEETRKGESSGVLGSPAL